MYTILNKYFGQQYILDWMGTSKKYSHRKMQRYNNSYVFLLLVNYMTQ